MQRNWRCSWPDFGMTTIGGLKKKRDHFHLISHRWRGQALSLWSGSSDSKTVDYQGTNPGEYQIVRTPTKETTWTQDPASPNHQQHPVQDTSSKQQTKQKCKTNHQQTELSPHSALPIRWGWGNLSTNLTLYNAYTNHWTNLMRAESKRKKEFNPEKVEKRRPQTQ